MRGSPLVRSILCALALVGTAVGLARITRARPAPQSGNAPSQNADRRPVVTGVPFELVLSAAASEITIDTGTVHRPSPEILPITGKLQLDPANPRVALRVRWKTAPQPGERRFAKLTLEPAAQPTLQHVFDAAGEINDVFEFPVLNAP